MKSGFCTGETCCFVYICLSFLQQLYVILIWVDLSCLFVMKSGFCTGETCCFVYILWCLVRISSQFLLYIYPKVCVVDVLYSSVHGPSYVDVEKGVDKRTNQDEDDLED